MNAQNLDRPPFAQQIQERIRARNEMRGLSVIAIDGCHIPDTSSILLLMEHLGTLGRKAVTLNMRDPAAWATLAMERVSQMYICMTNPHRIDTLTDICKYRGIPCYVYKEG